MTTPLTTDQQYTQRYVTYCAVHGKTPQQMLAHDKKEWPGGYMCGFTLWISARWQEWQKAGGRAGDHAAFDAWLGAYSIREAA